MKALAMVLMLAAAAAASSARADCTQWLDACEKSIKQSRVAWYEVKSPEQPLSGKPDTVCIGKTCYDRLPSGAYKRVETEDDADRAFLDELRNEAKQAKARCVPAGKGIYRGSAVTKIRFDSPDDPDQHKPTIWIDQRSGLIVYMEARGFGSYAFVYGDAVKEPVLGK